MAAAGGDESQVVAAVLLFRTLTCAIQISIGAFAYMIWRRKKGWQKEPSKGERRSSEQAAATV